MDVTFGEDGLAVGGNSTPLAAGEFHYWRQQRRFWRSTLEAMKIAGLDIVSSFVCWDSHEVEPGTYDFDGSTAAENDLLGFLALCDQLGMRVILRPGPIIDAEWETRGPAPDVCTLERNDPRFLVRAEQWIRSFARAIRPYLATRGGPVVLVAADNEIFFPYNSDPAWHEEDGDVFVPYKRDQAEGWLRGWLTERYESVETLNRTWGTEYGSFDDVPAPCYRQYPVPAVLDSFVFMDEYCAWYLDAIAHWLRDEGIDVPLYTNQKQFLTYLDWSTVGRSLDSVGLNLCMPDMLPGDQPLAVSWFVRLQRSRSGFPWSPEYQAGWIGFDKMFGVLSPEHGRFMGLLGIALGLRGMSFFMFVERDDWNWSPINSMGKIRPTRFAMYQDVISALRRVRPDRQLADVGLMRPIDEQRMHMASTTDGWEGLFNHWMELEEPKEHETWWQTFRALQDNDVDFRLVDPDAKEMESPPVLVWVPSSHLVSESAARAALNAAQQGKTVILVGTSLDELRERAAAIVKELLDRLAQTARIREAQLSVVVEAIEAAGARSWIRAGKGLWSFAYETNGGRLQLFVVNPGDEPRSALLSGEALSGCASGIDLVTGEAVTSLEHVLGGARAAKTVGAVQVDRVP